MISSLYACGKWWGEGGGIYLFSTAFSHSTYILPHHLSNPISTFVFFDVPPMHIHILIHIHEPHSINSKSHCKTKNKNKKEKERERE